MATIEDRIEHCERRLLRAVKAADHVLTGDGRVSEAAAAALIGVHKDTLRDWRGRGEGPDHFRIGGTVTYAVHDLAAFIEVARVHGAEARG